jgi:hypothetical protein
MQKPLLFVIACALWACSDSNTQTKTDAGEDKSDASDQAPDASNDAAAPSALGERPPGSLDRPPGTKLPDDLRPPKQ